MESIALLQGATLCGILLWIFLSSYLNLTQKIRSLTQPWVAHHVIAGTPLILQIQVPDNMRSPLHYLQDFSAEAFELN